MELSQPLVSAITKPSFFFGPDQPSQRSLWRCSTPETTWDLSLLNPKNRINSLDISHSGWRIDGATMCGRLFYAIPTRLLPKLIPLRIDVILPDQEQHPQELRETLQTGFSVPMRHPRLGDLGISRHICRALDYHCAENPDFFRLYQTLPFGSRLMFESISADVRAMPLSIVPAHDLERQWLSIDSLCKLWGKDISKDSWPAALNLDQLRLKSQLHDSITVVNLVVDSRHSASEDLIFKSSTTDPKFIYHELKFLLTSPPHPNLMSRPLYVVTKKCKFGGKHGVCGFILPYYPLGSLRDVLPMRAHTGSLTFEQQMRWSRQIVSALIHIRKVAETFYSDLRPDNVLISDSTRKDCQEIVLCDFEQRGNWYEWCAPEILYNMYAENLRTCPSPAAQSFLAEHVQETCLQNGPHGSNSPWFSLSPESQEKAMVYSLGLLLYCIFEGLSNPRNNLANAWPYEPDIAFPEFRCTPPFMQDCIKRCTADAPEWKLEAERSLSGIKIRRVWRIDGRLYPSRRPCEVMDVEDTVEAVWETARTWWASELQNAQVFFESDEWRYDRCGRERPTLLEVLEILKITETSQ